ncbi:MAG: iron ABC transporter permease [Chloroflexi bacterium]|nr:iron ABC transporter permease [Chloroflexota bacterium]
MRGRIRIAPDKLTFVVPALVVIYLVVPPLGLLILSSVRSTQDSLPLEAGPLTFDNYVHVFTSAETYQLLFNSSLYALASTMLGLVIATGFAWLLERTDIPASDHLFTLLLVPMAVPGLISAIAWALLLNPNNGILNVLMRDLFGLSITRGPLNIYSIAGMIFVSGLLHVPSILLMISGAFRSFDPAFEEASEASGVSRLMSQLRISLPLLRPTLAAAFIYYLVRGMEAFDIPAVLGFGSGLHVFSTKIYLATHPFTGLPDYGLASGYSMVLLLLSFVLIAAYRQVAAKQRAFAVVTGKGYRTTRLRLGNWRYAALGVVSIYLLLAVVLPALTLIWVSLQPYLDLPTLDSLSRLTLKNYRGMVEFGLFRTAVANIAIVLVIVATFTMLLSTFTAWMAVRRPFAGSSVPDSLVFIMIAVPGVVTALALMFVYLSVPLPIYGTIWILVIGFSTLYLVYASRLMGGSVIQIHQELEEASYASGVSSAITFRRIVIPLLMPSFLNGWLWIATHAMRETALSAMLLTPGNVVPAALLWNKWTSGGDLPLVAAMSVALMGAVVFLTLIGRSFLLRRGLGA